MKHYPEDFKRIMVHKYLSQPQRSIRSIAKEANVSKSTLHEWIRHFCNGNTLMHGIPSNERCLMQRLIAVTECSDLDELAIGQYCRSHGIYREHLKQWQECLSD